MAMVLLVHHYYSEHAAEAARLTPETALAYLLEAYLPLAVYVLPAMLARHLKIPEAVLCAGLDRLVEAARAVPLSVPGQRGLCYRWTL
jgi:hypothetical protein